MKTITEISFCIIGFFLINGFDFIFTYFEVLFHMLYMSILKTQIWVCRILQSFHIQYLALNCYIFLDIFLCLFLLLKNTHLRSSLCICHPQWTDISMNVCVLATKYDKGKCWRICISFTTHLLHKTLDHFLAIPCCILKCYCWWLFNFSSKIGWLTIIS